MGKSIDNELVICGYAIYFCPTILNKMNKIEFVQIDRNEFVELVSKAVRDQLRENGISNGRPTMVRGIRGLAEALSVSTTKIQQLKNDGVIPYFQNGKLLLFDLDKVELALNSYNMGKVKP